MNSRSSGDCVHQVGGEGDLVGRAMKKRPPSSSRSASAWRSSKGSIAPRSARPPRPRRGRPPARRTRPRRTGRPVGRDGAERTAVVAPGERGVALVRDGRPRFTLRGTNGARISAAARTPSAKSARVAQPGLLRALVLHGQPSLLDQAAAQRGPDGADGERPRRGQLVRVARWPVGQQVVRRRPGDHTGRAPAPARRRRAAR